MDVAAAAVDAFADLAQFFQRRRNEGLTAESGIHRHHQHQVDVFQHPVQHFQRRGRVQHDARLAALCADQLDGAVHVRAGFGVKADGVGAGLGEFGHQRIDRLHHQMHVDGRGDAVLAQCLADHRADGQVGHVVVVHNVEVDPVGAGGEHGFDFLAEAGEVGREDGWGDDRAGGHANSGVRQKAGCWLHPGRPDRRHPDPDRRRRPVLPAARCWWRWQSVR